MFVQYRASWAGIGYNAFNWALDINNRLDSRWQNNVCIYFFCYYQAFPIYVEFPGNMYFTATLTPLSYLCITLLLSHFNVY